MDYPQGERPIAHHAASADWWVLTTANTDQNNQVKTVFWRQYLFYALFNNIETLLHQNYIYFLIKKYYHVCKVGTAYMVCTRMFARV
jgi:hypothetical protein